MNPKKKILIIGSSVADVIMNVKKLPAPGEDVHLSYISWTGLAVR